MARISNFIIQESKDEKGDNPVTHKAVMKAARTLRKALKMRKKSPAEKKKFLEKVKKDVEKLKEKKKESKKPMNEEAYKTMIEEVFDEEEVFNEAWNRSQIRSYWWNFLWSYVFVWILGPFVFLIQYIVNSNEAERIDKHVKQAVDMLKKYKAGLKSEEKKDEVQKEIDYLERNLDSDHAWD